MNALYKHIIANDFIKYECIMSCSIQEEKYKCLHHLCIQKITNNDQGI